MHVAVRKSELDRIERENSQIAKSIYFARPKILTNKELSSEFDNHKKMSFSLAKIKRRTICEL